MGAQGKTLRVLIAKISLDGHWWGVAIVTAALRDAGMEVIYGGMMNAAQIVEAAIQEDVDVIGVNIGARYLQVKEMMQLLRQRGVEDMLVVAGGTVPREDIPQLKEMGVAEVFPPGSSLDSIVSFIKDRASRKGGPS